MVEVDRFAELVHDLGPEWVETDEQALEQLAVGQRIAAGEALETIVAAHDHDRCLLLDPRHGIPGDAQRRLEREHVPLRLDARDPHYLPW